MYIIIDNRDLNIIIRKHISFIINQINQIKRTQKWPSFISSKDICNNMYYIIGNRSIVI